jgi:hypothetical protein
VRKTSHRRRFHTDRVVQNRRRRYKRETPDWWGRNVAANHEEWLAECLSYGRLSDRDPWDCGSHCLLCHYDKFCTPRRAREKRAWRRDWL